MGLGWGRKEARTDTLGTKAEQGGQKQPRLSCQRQPGERQRQVNSFEKITRRLNLILQPGRVQRELAVRSHRKIKLSSSKDLGRGTGMEQPQVWGEGEDVRPQ